MELDEIKGIGPITKKKLNEAGIYSVMEMVVRGPVAVAEIANLDKDAANKYLSEARKYLQENNLIMSDFSDGLKVEERRNNVQLISTGTIAFDELLDGGLETGALTEIYGEFGCGKTQFCHTMCVQTQKVLDGNVLYIDTENTFRPKRIRSIAEARGMDPKKTLKNILVARAQDSAHQILILENSPKIIEENNIKLIVCDSMTNLFRAEYLGRGTLAERQQRLNHFMHLLAKIAEEYNVAAIGTNQVSSSPDTMFGDPTRAIGGNIVAHKTTYRLYFRKVGKKRNARMIDSPSHADNEILFDVDASGIIDYVEKKKK